MNSQVCVTCHNKKTVNSTDNRLIVESCGHVKCINCLLQEKTGCRACMKEESIKTEKTPSEGEEDVPNSPESGGSVDLSPTVVIEEKEKITKKKKPETSHIKVLLDGDVKCYKCTECNKVFHARSQVVYHAYCNGQQKPYKCPHDNCNNSFVSLSHYKYHLRVHSGERTFTCDICNKSFIQMSKLQRHMFKHTNEKQYACLQCSKAFNNVSALRKHSLTHTGERPYACEQCGRKFRDRSNYKKHLNKHIGVESPRVGMGHRQFQCPRCPLAFHSNKDMRRHAAIHTDSKPFRCKVCERHFRRKDNLERHIRNTHPNHAPASAVVCDVDILKQIASVNGNTEKPQQHKLKTMNPLPPLSNDVIQKHMESDENPIQTHESNLDIILEANHARQSVIVAKKPDVVPRILNIESEYVHKKRKANTMVCQKGVPLPPIDQKKLDEFNNLNSLDVGAPPKDVGLYKKILYDSEIGDDDLKAQSMSPVLRRNDGIIRY